MTDRIASFTQTGNILNNNLRLQSNYARTQTQVSSGYVSDRYEGLAGDTSRLLNVESDFERITQQTENAQLALDRTEIMYSALNSIIEQTQNFASDLQSTVSGFGLEGADLQNVAQTRLNSLVGNLNTQLADRFLFAGSATQTAPVDLTGFGGQVYVAPGPSVADTTYYQGNDYIQNIEASDSFVIDYGVLADDPAFEQIIRAYDLVITNPNDQDTLEEAFRLIQIGYDQSAILQATIAQDANTLQQQITANSEDLVLLETQMADIREVDLAEASTRLKQLETQLEASYSVTATLLKLSLADYIR